MLGETFKAIPVTAEAHVLISGLLEWATKTPHPTPVQLMVVSLVDQMAEASRHSVEMHCWNDGVLPGQQCHVCGEVEPE